jgi:hypothetical protein
MRELRPAPLAALRNENRSAVAQAAAAVRALRLAGLVTLASRLLDEDAPAVPESLGAGAIEILHDRLSDLARRLPACRRLPVMAVAVPLAGGSFRGGAGSTDAHAVLSALTHINGRTFDRDGLPLLVPDLAEGGAWDLYAPY